MKYYRGWKITYSTKGIGLYVAESSGVELSAVNRVNIERMIDWRIENCPPVESKPRDLELIS